jgi:hypothetical protein
MFNFWKILHSLDWLSCSHCSFKLSMLTCCTLYGGKERSYFAVPSAPWNIIKLQSWECRMCRMLHVVMMWLCGYTYKTYLIINFSRFIQNEQKNMSVFGSSTYANYQSVYQGRFQCGHLWYCQWILLYVCFVNSHQWAMGKLCHGSFKTRKLGVILRRYLMLSCPLNSELYKN